MNYMLDLSVLDRSKALRIWMLYHEITTSGLAQELDVDPSFVCRVLNCQKRSDRVLAKLTSLGVPASLLPEKKKQSSTPAPNKSTRRGRPPTRKS